MSIELLSAVGLLLSLGVIGGILAGLLGIGGGAILVPGLYYILKHLGYHENTMHIAVGTSLLTIVFTGISSAYAHYRKGAVDITMLKNFLPGILGGGILGTLLADLIPSIGLKIIFGSYMILRMNRTNIFHSIPKQPLFSAISAANACLSTLMGVGGGVQNITFMTICNVE